MVVAWISNRSVHGYACIELQKDFNRPAPIDRSRLFFYRLPGTAVKH